MTFTIEQLEEMRSKITPGDRYLHEDDWGDLCVVNDDGRYMNWGDQLVVKIEAGHPEHDGESIVAIPALLAQLIAEMESRQKLRHGIEALRESYTIAQDSERRRDHFSVVPYVAVIDEIHRHLTQILEENK